MKKATFTLLIALGMISGLHAQYAIQWQKSLGGTDSDIASDVKATPDGGCIVVGESWSYDGDVTGNKGSGDGWIVKLDASGNIEWERTLGGSMQDALRAVALTPDGGYVVVGNTSSDDGDVTGFNVGPFGDMIWVVKLDALGNIEWNDCYGGSGSDFARNISTTTDGGYTFIGNSTSTDGDVTGFHPPANPWEFSNDIWAVKINSTGVIEQERCFGGSKNEFPDDFRETPDGGYIILGETWGSSNGDVVGNTDTSITNSTAISAWVVKLDAAFNIEWQETYGGSKKDSPIGSIIPENGGYTFLALTGSNDGDVIGFHGDTVNFSQDFWLVHLNAAGIIQWQHCFGSDSSGAINPGGFTKMQNGGYAMACEITGQDSDYPGFHPDPLNTLTTDYGVVITDSLGTMPFQHCYGSFKIDKPSGVAQSADGGIIIAGNSGGNNGDVSGHHGPLDMDDIWILKLVDVPAGVQNPVNTVHAFNIYPNPVSTSAKIDFYLAADNQVTVSIYDMSGKLISTLMDEYLNSGYQQLNWDCQSDNRQMISNGVYMVKITAGNYAAYSKITILQ